MVSPTSGCHQHYSCKLLKIYTVIETKENSISIDNKPLTRKTPKTQRVTNQKMKNKKITRQKKIKIFHLDIWISSLIVKMKWRDYQVMADINLKPGIHGPAGSVGSSIVSKNRLSGAVTIGP